MKNRDDFGHTESEIRDVENQFSKKQELRKLIDEYNARTWNELNTYDLLESATVTLVSNLKNLRFENGEKPTLTYINGCLKRVEGLVKVLERLRTHEITKGYSAD